MRFASACSGIEGAGCAWEPLGWQHAFCAEIDPFASAVLAHRFPNVPNVGDFTKLEGWPDAVDVLVAGTPCQSFSVAGRRAGPDDPRGLLAFELLRLAGRLRPRWLVFENVPGLLSSDDGRDFGAFLGALGDVGYGFAYRVLDAQWFGVAQRRARVFVVARLGDWRGPCAVLLEPEGLRGDSAPSRTEGEGVAPTLANRARGGGGLGTDAECDGALIAPASFDWSVGDQKNNPRPGTMNLQNDQSLTLRREHVPAVLIPLQEVSCAREKKQNGAGIGEHGDPCYTLEAGHQHGVVCVDPNQITSKANRSVPKPGLCHTLPAVPNSPLLVAHPMTASGTDGMGRGVPMTVCPTVTSKWAKGSGGPAGSETGNLRAARSAVRRFTPRECERLQGFPDDWTLVPYRGKPAKDSPRYRAIGNAFPVPVLRWIGERIAMFEEVSR